MKPFIQEGATGLIAVILATWGKYKFVSKDQLNDKLDDMKEHIGGTVENIEKQLDGMEKERSKARTEHTQELTEIFRSLGRLEGKGK